MQSKQKDTTSKLDIVKWGIGVLLVLGGFVANYYFAGQPLPLKIGGWIILVCIVLLVLVRTVQGRKAWKFFKEARAEMRKVTWPGRQQIFQTTLIVVAMVVVFAIVMWGFDTIIMWAIGLLTGQRG